MSNSVVVFRVKHDVWADDFVGAEASYVCSKNALRHIAYKEHDIIFGSFDKFNRVKQGLFDKKNFSDANSIRNIKNCAEFNDAPKDITLHDAIIRFAHCGGSKPTYEQLDVLEVIEGNVLLKLFTYRT